MVYRGMGTSLSKLGPEYATNGIFLWPAFSSTTTHIEVTSTFMASGVMFHLKLAENVARNITDFSFYPTEREILLPPNMLFKVISSFHQGSLSILQCEQLQTQDIILNLAS